MISIDIHAMTREGKNTEFYNAVLGFKSIPGLIVQLQNQIGCMCYQFKEINQNENEFHIKSEWQNWVGLETHLQSDLFCVLLGVLQTLCTIQHVTITDGPCEYGMELFEKLRR